MSQTDRPIRVLIAGAGIGGLAAAVSLERVSGLPGVDIQLYEQAPELREIGASIALSPNVCVGCRLRLARRQATNNTGDRECEHWNDLAFMRPSATTSDLKAQAAVLRSLGMNS